VFTTYKISRYVFASDVPLEGKLLNDKLINYDDIERLKSQLKISPIAFKYDGVSNE
jgi:hypothetical protein